MGKNIILAKNQLFQIEPDFIPSITTYRTNLPFGITQVAPELRIVLHGQQSSYDWPHVQRVKPEHFHLNGSHILWHGNM